MSYWDAQGFFTVVVRTGHEAARIKYDESCARELAGVHRDGGDVHLHYRLKMIEDVLDSAGKPTGEEKVSWVPKQRVQYAGGQA
jgi:hypothetical protein